MIYFATDAKITVFDCDRDEFIGSYKSEENPQNVDMGRCTNSTMYGGAPCFALEIDVDLKANEGETVNVFLSTFLVYIQMCTTLRRWITTGGRYKREGIYDKKKENEWLRVYN